MSQFFGETKYHFIIKYLIEIEGNEGYALNGKKRKSGKNWIHEKTAHDLTQFKYLIKILVSIKNFFTHLY